MMPVVISMTAVIVCILVMIVAEVTATAGDLLFVSAGSLPAEFISVPVAVVVRLLRQSVAGWRDSCTLGIRS